MDDSHPKHALSVLAEAGKVALVQGSDALGNPLTPMSAEKKLEQLAHSIVEDQRELDKLMVGGLVRALQIGRALTEVKALLPHGKFQTWVEAELTSKCRISLRSAQRYMQLFNQQHRWRPLAIEFYRGDHLPTSNEAKALFASLRVADVLELLAKPNKRKTHRAKSNGNENRNRNDQSNTDTELVELTSNLLRTLFANDPEFAAKWCLHSASSVPSQALIESCLVLPHVAAEATLAAIQSAVTTFLEGERPIVIAGLPYSGMANWHRLLESYPRVHVRDANTKKHSVRFIAGIVSTQHVDAFQRVFGTMGAGFYPARNYAHSHSTDEVHCDTQT